MNQVAQFLTDSKTFFLATAEKDQPHVRPFGAVAEWDGKTYICTNNTKKVYEQMLENPKVEITAMLDGKWLRLSGKIVADHRPEAREAMLKANPSLNNIYRVDDGIFEVLYFSEATAMVYSFTGQPQELSF